MLANNAMDGQNEGAANGAEGQVTQAQAAQQVAMLLLQAA